MNKTFSISGNRKDKKLLCLAVVGDTIDSVWDTIHGHSFDGFCEKREGFIAFASFQREAVEKMMTEAGYTKA